MRVQWAYKLKAWSAIAPKLFIWDYVSNVTGPLTPHPKHQVLGKDLRTYLDHHAVGVFLEGESIGATDFIGLKNYLMARLLWDPSRDESAVIDEFLNGYYGKAAPALRQVLDLYAEKASPAFLSANTEGLDAEWLDLAAMNRATELFQQAENAVEGNPVELARVKWARISLDNQWLRSYGRYREQADREQDQASHFETFPAFVVSAAEAVRDGLRAVANDRARVVPGPLLAAAVAVALVIPFCIVRRILTAKAASF